MNARHASIAVPWAIGALAVAALALWLAVPPQLPQVVRRVPGMDFIGQASRPADPVVDIKGAFARGPGRPSELPGSWPRFRGPNFDAISSENVPLLRQFPPGGPRTLWRVELAEGYAGAAVHNGRVYLLDYDPQKSSDVLRCLSLADGQEIWQRSYVIEISRNHGITRTVPAVTDKYVLTIGPKCHVLCADALTGEFRWGIDLVREYQAKVPEWYTGQCPLIDNGLAILAPGGSALMIAVDCESGKVLWQTPNPRRWNMTHSSIIPMTFNGQRMYVYCASGGVVGVSADDGSVLWQTDQWKITMANVPCPVPVPPDRIFLSGGYGAGSLMLRLTASAGGIVPSVQFRLAPAVFGAEQHTPILYKNHIFGLQAPMGQLVCLNLDGQPVWNSGGKYRFVRGPFMIADDLILALSENGLLVLAEATPEAFRPLAEAQIINNAHEAWAPLALAGGRLLARDLTRMVCLDLRREAYD